MTQDEIIEMARQAGMVQDGDVWFSANNYEQCDVHTAELEAFAKLVAAAERSQCAALCSRFAARSMSPAECADAIRARGEA